MTNIDRAAEVLADWVMPGVPPEVVAHALAAAGLLAPDLPTVHVADFDGCPHVTITGTHAMDDARLRVSEHGVFHAINAWSDPQTPAEARERAYALLALANHAEGISHD